MCTKMASAAQLVGQNSKQILKHCLGLCYPSSKGNAIKVRITKLIFNDYLKMYFNDFLYVYAHDPNNKCMPGDTVLIKPLPEKMTRLITHEIIDIIYPMGDVTDPISGEKVYLNKYRSEVEKVNELYGKHGKAFDYYKLPPRGRMQGIRDFTDKETYIKCYDDPNDPQPYGV